MHFITTDSELEIKRNTIYQKRLVVPVRTYWLHSFILLLIYIGYSFYETVTEKPYRWVSVLLGISWIAPHLVTIYRFLFKKSWRQNIPVSKIKSVERKQLNQLE
ncbi:MAG: hypothetical protein JWP88_201, partial [Flaviaesturariibacter sp.]|nr:hypothetical protein [Flaviaesturariibacter sp.]